MSPTAHLRAAAAEQLASAKGETSRFRTRKAPAVQVLFVVEVRGVEPRSNRPLTVLSTCLAGVWRSLASVRRRTLARQARDDSGLTGRWDRVVCFYDAACSGNRKPEGDTLPRLSSEGELHGGVLLRIFFAFIFYFRYYADEPAACLPRLKPTVEAGTPPRRRVTRRR